MHDSPSVSMGPDPRPALVVVATAFEAVERVRRALGEEFAVVRCATVAEARVALAGPRITERRIAGLMVEPRDARDAATAPLVRLVRERARTADAIPVLAMVRRSAPWCPATVALLEAHPAVVLIVEDLDLGAVVRALATRLRRAAFVGAAWRALEQDVPAELRPLVRVALARAAEPLSVQAIARDLGLHRKTLWSRCRRHGMGSMQALMTWCRLLAVEHALRSCSRPIDAIAEELAFASPTALRNAVRRHLRTTPSALREERGEGVVCAEFRAWMRRLRPPPCVTMGDVA